MKPNNKNDTIKKRKKKQKEKWLEAYKTQWTITGACRKIGISRNAFYEWAKKDPVFLEQKEDVKKEHLDLVESKLVQLINELNVTAIIFYLKNQSEAWRAPEKREISGNIKSEELEIISENIKKLASKNYAKARTIRSGKHGGDSGNEGSSEELIQELKRKTI